ncbi:HD domain-containing protein [Pantoea sp. 1.19]|uniref:HD domain-containing protein n=1 Tax=Pantoea sp. 1.19 TaxID=1925589 RepID=UPI000948DF70|nr:HD domain-containing protein [Pantoea sp. 1.19]
MMQSREEQARRFATHAHAEAGQRRKYSDEPYIVHPAAVVELVRSVPHSEAMLLAAWLHDTVEDTATTLQDLRAQFGKEVAALVEMLTDVPQPQAKNRMARKLAHFQHTAQASPPAQTIKLADIIDNTRNIVRVDPDFARVYLMEKRLQVQLLSAGDPTLLRQAQQVIEGGIAQLQEKPWRVPAAWFEALEARYRGR